MDNFRLGFLPAIAVPFSRAQTKDLAGDKRGHCVRFGFGRSKMNIPGFFGGNAVGGSTVSGFLGLVVEYDRTV